MNIPCVSEEKTVKVVPLQLTYTYCVNLIKYHSYATALQTEAETWQTSRHHRFSWRRATITRGGVAIEANVL